MKFEIRKSKWRQRYWVRIVAANGQVSCATLATFEGLLGSGR